MSTPPRVPLNLGLTRMLDRLGGAKSARLPELLETVQPVVIYSDLSASITSEIFEARAVCSVDVNSPPGRYPAIEIPSNAPGGIVVERLTVRVPNDANGVALAVSAISATTIGPVTPVDYVDIGGRPVTSRPQSDSNVLAHPAPHSAIYVDQNTVADLVVERIYVPAAWWFYLSTHSAQGILQATVVWRELEDIQGA